METPDSSNSGQDLSTEFAEYFAKRQAYLDTPEPLYTLDWFERQTTDYAEKLIHTPLPPRVIQDQLGAAIELAQESGRINQQFTYDFLQALEIVLSAYINKLQPGDQIAFNDLVDEADRAIESVDLANDIDILSHPVYLEQNHAISLILRDFAETFYQRTELRQICDEIDEWTVHDDVHPAQKERRLYDPATPFYGEPHGYNGRWTPEDRDGLTVWVAS